MSKLPPGRLSAHSGQGDGRWQGNMGFLKTLWRQGTCPGISSKTCQRELWVHSKGKPITKLLAGVTGKEVKRRRGRGKCIVSVSSVECSNQWLCASLCLSNRVKWVGFTCGIYNWMQKTLTRTAQAVVPQGKQWNFSSPHPVHSEGAFRIPDPQNIHVLA